MQLHPISFTPRNWAARGNKEGHGFGTLKEAKAEFIRRQPPPTTCSSYWDNNWKGSNVFKTDGNGWHAKGSKGWISFDFSSEQPLESLILWNDRHRNGSCPRHIEVQMSKTSHLGPWKTIHEVDLKNPGRDLHQQVIKLPKKVKTRYLRLLCHNEYGYNHIVIQHLEFKPQRVAGGGKMPAAAKKDSYPKDRPMAITQEGDKFVFRYSINSDKTTRHTSYSYCGPRGDIRGTRADLWGSKSVKFDLGDDRNFIGTTVTGKNGLLRR